MKQYITYQRIHHLGVQLTFPVDPENSMGSWITHPWSVVSKHSQRWPCSQWSNSYPGRLHDILVLVQSLGIQAPKLRMVMEPKYYAFRRWLDTTIISREYDDWCLGNIHSKLMGHNPVLSDDEPHNCWWYMDIFLVKYPITIEVRLDLSYISFTTRGASLL